jgi:hypothetical protein
LSKAVTWLKRSAVVAVGSAAILTVVSTPSLAANSLSTTGASGTWAYSANGTYNLYARDTLSDGHCAQWERKPPGGSWTTDTTDPICSGTSTWSGIAQFGDQIRICRTGVWNCSGTHTL